jgi:hypothetical protein
MSNRNTLPGINADKKGNLVFLLAATALFFVAGAFAGPRDYLFKDKRVCDTQNVFCFRGTLSFDSNPRLLHLRARVQTAPGPGMLRIRLRGANELGHRRLAPIEIQIRGNYSEIINHRMVPDHPDVYEWHVGLVEFIAAAKSDPAYRPR